MRRRARQIGGRLGPVRRKQRHDLPAQKIAGEAGVRIGRIFYPRESVLPGIGFQLSTRHRQQRAHQLALAKRPGCRHAAQATHASATQQAKQQRLGLIVTMLGGEQHVAGPQRRGEGGIARLARRLFQAGGVALHLDMGNLQWDAQPLTHRAAMRRPGFGSGLQTMGNMNGRKRRQRLALAQLGQQMQQHGGIQAAGEGHAPGRRVAPGRQGMEKSIRKRHGGRLAGPGPGKQGAD